jgi:hypothetical protein
VAELWQKIVPANHHLVSPDIQALEDSRPEDIEFIYINVLEKGEPIGVIYVQHLNFNRKHYSHNIFERSYLKPFKSLVTSLHTGILVCGNLFRVDFQGFYFSDKNRRDLIFNCLHAYKESLNAGRSISGILVKDCSREFNEVQFGCHSFKSFTQDMTMELEIHENWETFKDYLGDLSRKYRQRAVKVQSSMKDIELIDLSLTDLVEHKEQLFELYMNIVRQQSLALGLLSPGYFISMKSSLGENFKVTAYALNGKILAFSSHIYYPVKNYMEIHYIGLDYHENQKYQLYFNILFDGIRTAIEKKFRKIEMGRTAREAKASAGAHPVPNHNYIWIKPGLIRVVVSFLSKWFENCVGDEWKKRQPFKSVPNNAAVQV